MDRENTMKKHKYKILVALVSTIYFLISVFNLGSFNAFNTYYQPENVGEEVVVEFAQPSEFESIYFVSGEGNNNINTDTLQYGVNFEISGSNDVLQCTLFILI